MAPSMNGVGDGGTNEPATQRTSRAIEHDDRERPWPTSVVPAFVQPDERADGAADRHPDHGSVVQLTPERVPLALERERPIAIA